MDKLRKPKDPRKDAERDETGRTYAEWVRDEMARDDAEHERKMMEAEHEITA